MFIYVGFLIDRHFKQDVQMNKEIAIANRINSGELSKKALIEAERS